MKHIKLFESVYNIEEISQDVLMDFFEEYNIKDGSKEKSEKLENTYYLDKISNEKVGISIEIWINDSIDINKIYTKIKSYTKRFNKFGYILDMSISPIRKYRDIINTQEILDNLIQNGFQSATYPDNNNIKEYYYIEVYIEITQDEKPKWVKKFAKALNWK